MEITSSKLFITLLTISVFGPYIFPSLGIRGEHILIYPMFIYCIFKLIPREKVLVNGVPHLVKGIYKYFTLIIVWTTLSTLILILNYNYNAETKFTAISYLENYIQPFAILTIMITIFRSKSATFNRQFFLRFITIIMLLLSVNSVLALLTIKYDLSPVLNYFFRGDITKKGSFWLAVTDMRRYTGIFNMPFTSGVIYSFGLLLLAFKFKQQVNRLSLIDIIFFIGLLIGGSLSISKVFLLGGIPLFIFYIVLDIKNNNKYKRKLLIYAIIILALGGYIVSYLTQLWHGGEYITRYFNGTNSTNILNFYSAGRFGTDDSYLIYLFNNVWQNALFMGFGYGASSILDNQYIEFLYQGGIIALILYITIIFIMLKDSITATLYQIEEGKLLFFVTLLLIGAGLGAPVVTLNRFNVILWITIMFLSVEVEKNKVLPN